MTDKIETTKKAEAKAEEKIVEQGQVFNFTQDNFVVRAASLAEAQKLYKNTLKEKKESQNG